MLVDWLTIKTEYINSNISQRDIAKKYNVSFSTLQVRARKEKWTEERKKQYDEIEASVRQKALDVISKQKIDRVTKLLTISDALVPSRSGKSQIRLLPGLKQAAYFSRRSMIRTVFSLLQLPPQTLHGVLLRAGAGNGWSGDAK